MECWWIYMYAGNLLKDYLHINSSIFKVGEVMVPINPENSLSFLSLLGPLLYLEKFDVSCIKWCSMHVINLGILGNLNGGCVILGECFEHNHFILWIYGLQRLYMYCWLWAPWPISTVTHLFLNSTPFNTGSTCWSSQQSVLTSITRVHQDYVGRAVALLGKSWLPNMYGQCLQGFCGLHQNQQNGSLPATFHYQNGSLAKIDCSTVCSSFWGLCGSVSKAK